jgi:hypothetical protein
MVDKTRRELLSEAFDKMEEGDDEEVVVAEPENDSALVDDTDKSEARPDTGEPEVQESDGETVERKKTPKTEKVGKKPAPTEEEKQEAEAARKDAEGKTGEEGKSVPVTDKAPNSWKPAVREAWAKIPAEARAEITRREREIETTLSQTANIRKFAGDFAAVVNPFSHLIRSQNSTPLHAVQNLMTTAAGLMTGNDDQKASIVAEIIQNYGVNCETLDNILAAISQKNGGRIPNRQQARPMEQVPSWAQPILASHKRMETLQHQHEQRMQQEADEEISKVEAEPYFHDLRDDVADIMEVAANRNRKITVREAYQMAVKLHPEISKLVSRQKTVVPKQNITRARRAASSISGSPSSGSGVGAKRGEKMSRREMLSEAWDEAGE